MAKKKRKRRPSSHARLGKIFEAECAKSFRVFQNKVGKKFYYKRVPDTMSYIRAGVPKIILPRQPCDFLCLYNGQLFAIECKSRHSERFDLEHLKEHQKEGMRAIEDAGGISYVLMSWRKRRPVECHAVPINTYLQLELRAIAEGRKSIPKKWFDESETVMKLRRIPRLGFLLDPIFQS